MRTRIDARLRLEAARFGFRFACDDCAHFAVDRERCSLGHPAEPRRGALGGAAAEDGHFSTCKDFDLV